MLAVSRNMCLASLAVLVSFGMIVAFTDRGGELVPSMAVFLWLFLDSLSWYIKTRLR